MPPTVRLRSRMQTTGPQSSTRLLKRPGERPRVAKPQPSEQGLPPRRKPGAKLRSRRSARQQRRRGSKPSSERSVKLPRRRSATLREKPSARRRGRQSAKPLRKRRSRLPNARNAGRRRRPSVKPPARSSAKRPRRQSEKLPGSRRWRLPHRQNARRLNEQNAGRRTGNPSVNQPKAKLPRNQSPAYPTGRRLQMASDGNECAGRRSNRNTSQRKKTGSPTAAMGHSLPACSAPASHHVRNAFKADLTVK